MTIDVNIEDMDMAALREEVKRARIVWNSKLFY